ncbi:MAG: DUF4012 domain-containing protein, partial [Actinomycetota bacterium]
FAARSIWQNVNMTPDFPTSAGLIAQMWQARTGQGIDGVIAADAVALGRLLGVTGPVSVPDWPEPLTAENFVDVALNRAYAKYPDKPDRADFLLRGGREVWGRLLSSEGLDLRRLAPVMGGLFGEKHMQIWTRGEAKSLKAMGVDGSLRRPADDYLLVVGQNAAGNKVDFYAHRVIEYKAKVAAGGEVASTASVTLDNRTPSTGVPSYISGPYSNLPDPAGLNRSFLSLYAGGRTEATGARLDGKAVGVESESERGLSVLSRFLEVRAGEEAKLEFDLKPDPVADGVYRLVVQRQAALRPDKFRLTVDLPPGAVATDMTPGMKVAGGRATWEGRLTSDREFFVAYSTSMLDRMRLAARRALAGLR